MRLPDLRFCDEHDLAYLADGRCPLCVLDDPTIIGRLRFVAWSLYEGCYAQFSERVTNDQVQLRTVPTAAPAASHHCRECGAVCTNPECPPVGCYHCLPF